MFNENESAVDLAELMTYRWIEWAFVKVNNNPLEQCLHFFIRSRQLHKNIQDTAITPPQG